MTPLRTARPLLLLAAAALLTALSGCATVKPAGSQPRTEFLKQAWVAPDYQDAVFAERFDTVCVAPVNTTHLQRQDWWQAQNVPELLGRMSNDAELVGAYLRRAMIREIEAYPGTSLRVVDTPGTNTLLIQAALVELVPSKAFWNSAATSAGFILPGAGLLSAAGRGSIAMEARMVEARTGRVIALFADRREDLVAPVNLRSYTWFAGSDANIDIWARQGARFLHAPPAEEIRRQSQFTLRPW